MIRFRTLGGVDLRDADGREVRPVLAQPKRLALLAYLALAAPAGYCRRDTVLALFWPELDQERARGALRQAVHFLRRTLGAQVVQGHGGEDIGLSADALWCDARVFDAALSRGAPAEALELYHGDLLDGFFVSDASSEFDAWLEQERLRLRQRAIDAAWSLTDQHEAAAHGAEAARWARWAAARAPDDERTQRRLIALLDRLGDRTGALRAYEQLVQRTRTEFGAEPSAETRALVTAIRARDIVAASPTADLAPVEATRTGMESVAPDPRESSGAAPRDVVGPAPDPGVAAVPLPAGISPRLVRVPPRARRWLIAAAAVIVAGAATFAFQSPHGQRLAASPIAGAATGARATVRGSHARREVVTTSSAVAARFFEAGLRALYDQGDTRLARSLFRDALQDDTTFAMAAYYVAECDVTLHAPLQGAAMMATAMRLAGRVSERERLIIATGWATMTEDPHRVEIAESLATRYPEEPDGQLALASALNAMGDFLGAVPHLRRVIASDSLSSTSEPLGCASCVAFETLVTSYLLADSLPAAERTAREWSRRQPQSAAAWDALRGVLGQEGKVRDADEAEQQLVMIDPSTDVDLATAILAVHADDYAEADRLLSSRLRYGGAAAAGDALWWLVIVRRNQGRMADALALARRYEALRTPAPPGEIAGLAEAQVLFEQGHPVEAARLFDSLATLPPPTSPAAVGSLARHLSWVLTHAGTAWAAAGDTARLARHVDQVEGAARLSAYGRDWSLPHYLRGLLLRARGDTAQSLRELRRSIWARSDGYTRANFELARAELAAGHPRAAVSLLQAALRGPVEASNFYLTRTEVHELLARSFAAAGDADSAAAHYEMVVRSWSGGDEPFRRRAAQAEAERARLTHATAREPGGDGGTQRPHRRGTSR